MGYKATYHIVVCELGEPGWAQHKLAMGALTGLVGTPAAQQPHTVQNTAAQGGTQPL